MTFKLNDIVSFTGTQYYNNSKASATPRSCKPGPAKITALAPEAAHPYHLIYVSNAGSTVYGWVDEKDIAILSASVGTAPKTDPMKYSLQNPPMQCMMTHSEWYKGAVKNATPIGILWHDTGAGNTTIKRYVQPYQGDKNYTELMEKLGKNLYGNDWNHTNRQAGVNAFIGELADGSISTVQVGEWTMSPWGCGGGDLGSCNGYERTSGSTKWVKKHWIQFEICDDGYKDAEYFKAVYNEAIQLTAYLCNIYNLDPKGTVKFAGIDVPVITCHYDSYHMKLGSNHGDVITWFKKMGKTMDDVRNDVAKLLAESKAYAAAHKTSASTGTSSASSASAALAWLNNLAVGDEIKLKPGSTYYTGKKIPDWVFKAKTLYVRKIKEKTVTFSTLKEGDVTGTVYKTAIQSMKKAKAEKIDPYVVRILADALNIRAAADANAKIVGTVHKGQAFTIVEEKNGFGKLKSGVGWIKLATYTEKVKK